MGKSKKNLAGSTLKEGKHSYLFVESRDIWGAYDVCEYMADPNSAPGARVYARGEHLSNVPRGYLESLEAAEECVAREVEYRERYNEVYRDQFDKLAKETDEAPRSIAERCHEAACAATASLKALACAS